MDKPNWTFNELNENIKRLSDLMDAESECEETAECTCNPCIEYFRLDTLLDLFSQDEKATAVIRANQGRGNELVNPKLESEFIRV